MAEREPVTYVAVKGEMENDEDIEASVDGWRESLKGAETPGLVRAYRLPFDQNGMPSYNAKNQVRLGSWPIDHYSFDELCNMIVKEFMFPNEKQMAVRLIGTRQGLKGTEFNKIVMLQRPKSETQAAAESTPESMSGIMKAITESNERMLRMVQEIRPGAFNPANDPAPQNRMTEMMQFASMMRVMMEPMTAMMAPMMQLLAGRPSSSESPTGMLKGLVETMAVLDGLRGGQGMGVGDKDGNSAASIFRSVADVAAPLLSIAAKSQGAQPNPVHARRALPAPSPNPTPRSVAGSGPSSAATAGALGVPANAPGGVDLSRPSVAPVSTMTSNVDLSQPSPVPQPGSDPMLIQAKQIVDSLVSVAQQGGNPKEFAQAFFEGTMLRMEDPVYEMLCNQLEAPNFIDQIAMLNSQVRTYGIFFSQLQQALLELIHAESEAADAEDDDSDVENE
jgi:hypothetical protein